MKKSNPPIKRYSLHINWKKWHGINVFGSSIFHAFGVAFVSFRHPPFQLIPRIWRSTCPTPVPGVPARRRAPVSCWNAASWDATQLEVSPGVDMAAEDMVLTVKLK